jgi:hypothetical protein
MSFDRRLTQAARAAVTARFILDEATALGIRVGTDGDEVILVAPMRVPRETRRWFETQLAQHGAEVIAIIMADAGASS